MSLDKIKIKGGQSLHGNVHVAGSKNAALPILVSTLLSDQTTILNQVPRLQDIDSTIALLKHLGVTIDDSLFKTQSQLKIKADHITSQEAPYDLVRKMRASVLVLGPLLARFGKAKVSLPGGCAIGARPIDLHLKGLKQLGAEIELEEGYVLAKAKKLIGTRVELDFPSVGATENLMMACVLAQGESLITNAAKEPEIIDCARALKQMGVKIEGEGTDQIQIQGVTQFKPSEYTIMGDRIEAGTYLAAALITKGEVEVFGIQPESLESVLILFEKMGAWVQRNSNSIKIRYQSPLQATRLTTQPFPGFPTDMQAQVMSLLCLAEGESTITETIFENRFMHVPELLRMGADIKVESNRALIKGVSELKGAPVMATDLRASASLVLAGLAASGTTTVNRIYHLDRGYENLETKLSQLGAQIKREK